MQLVYRSSVRTGLERKEGGWGVLGEGEERGGGRGWFQDLGGTYLLTKFGSHPSILSSSSGHCKFNSVQGANPEGPMNYWG